MTLREEIELILMKPIYSDKAIDEILKIFEQRIDRTLTYFHNGYHTEGLMYLEDLKKELKK